MGINLQKLRLEPAHTSDKMSSMFCPGPPLNTYEVPSHMLVKPWPGEMLLSNAIEVVQLARTGLAHCEGNFGACGP